MEAREEKWTNRRVKDKKKRKEREGSNDQRIGVGDYKKREEGKEAVTIIRVQK